MKLKLFFSFLAVFQVLLSYGQTFAPVGAEWYYSSSAGGRAPGGSEYYHFIVQKDTVINNYDLRKVTRTYYRYQGDSVNLAPYFIYQEGDTVSLYNNELNKFYRLLVFNVSVDDTLTMDVPYGNLNGEDSTYRIVVEDIITEIYDGVELKKYILKQPDEFGWFSHFYLEKIGGYEWFLPLGKIIIPEADGPVRCYHDDEVNINFSPSRECDYRLVSNVSESLSAKIKLYPNPAAGLVQINADLGIDKTEVLDYSGKVLIETADTLINIESLSSGVYFFRIYSGDEFIVKKVVKN
ncbi:T9SS type A sorting domain-containing protein [Cytophagaceae bacterium ABcell3]|nr:T9SS type A sorting domain-containing protein [Cytophagaceae bacterium ABcell3]